MPVRQDSAALARNLTLRRSSTVACIDNFTALPMSSPSAKPDPYGVLLGAIEAYCDGTILALHRGVDRIPLGRVDRERTQMWPPLVSGLLCLPAVILLLGGWLGN